MDMFKADIDCDPEDARFERLDGTDGSAEIKQFVPIFEASHCHSHGVLFWKEKEEKNGMLPHLIMFCLPRVVRWTC